MTDGLIIAAPASGSGKTVVTLGLLGALKAAGVAVASAKAGPDYIDPRFHEAATAVPCVNLDLWAMGPETIGELVAGQCAAADLLLVEGVMGLFDGPKQGLGSTADLAALLGLPVVLVIDAARQGQSVAALARGFSDFRQDFAVAGVILNRVGSKRHAEMLRLALSKADVPVFGAVPRDASLALPERHLGLVQAAEHDGLACFLARAAGLIARSVDLAGLRKAARPVELAPAAHTALSSCQRRLASNRAAQPAERPHGTPAFAGVTGAPALPPLGQTIALASDAAFGFAYPHMLSAWRNAGASIIPFSPLADQPPDHAADAVFLPGGYPELHAGKLAGNRRFLAGLRAAAERGALVYGECGGFMVLGEHLIDAQGRPHAMAGLLPVVTSFAERRLSLGYRRLSHSGPLPFPRALRGHEFHYSTLARQGEAAPLFLVQDAAGRGLGPAGLRLGRVMGSYLHVIDSEAG